MPALFVHEILSIPNRFAKEFPAQFACALWLVGVDFGGNWKGTQYIFMRALWLVGELMWVAGKEHNISRFTKEFPAQFTHALWLVGGWTLAVTGKEHNIFTYWEYLKPIHERVPGPVHVCTLVGGRVDVGSNGKGTQHIVHFDFPAQFTLGIWLVGGWILAAAGKEHNISNSRPGSRVHFRWASGCGRQSGKEHDILNSWASACVHFGWLGGGLWRQLERNTVHGIPGSIHACTLVGGRVDVGSWKGTQHIFMRALWLVGELMWAAGKEHNMSLLLTKALTGSIANRFTKEFPAQFTHALWLVGGWTLAVTGKEHNIFIPNRFTKDFPAQFTRGLWLVGGWILAVTGKEHNIFSCVHFGWWRVDVGGWKGTQHIGVFSTDFEPIWVWLHGIRGLHATKGRMDGSSTCDKPILSVAERKRVSASKYYRKNIEEIRAKRRIEMARKRAEAKAKRRKPKTSKAPQMGEGPISKAVDTADKAKRDTAPPTEFETAISDAEREASETLATMRLCRPCTPRAVLKPDSPETPFSNWRDSPCMYGDEDSDDDHEMGIRSRGPGTEYTREIHCARRTRGSAPEAGFQDAAVVKSEFFKSGQPNPGAAAEAPHAQLLGVSE
ncbi:hypothetical protein K438DRAFT_1782480 [Mycena galopus ATCC 62051]|nr:hypothetical protein K438DRAFT_1782480 [Mycena galopus ATCC 62051]